TGSGKTYAITGSSDHYEDRGIIPRSIEEVFDFINKTPEKYTIYISYLEIYNEIGYDLLNPKQHISCLEELPVMDVAKYRVTGNYFQILPTKSRKVILLEDSKGESHLRNLSVQKVSSEQEAMKLLFLGDTNRIIAETPMNVYSSRSHCIFTICITSKNSQSGKIRRSKLNLVDLAGSERIYKSNITGTTLNEAKYINLSLHYLEQVVLALSQKRPHVPFRNSMLTYMLRDSLSGNCMTVLLATLAVNKKNIDETVATCKFAQRVAEVNLEAVINEEIDPQQEIEYLKREIESLRKQLIQQSKFKISGKLSKEEKERWKKVINNYLNDSKDELHLTNFDMRHIQYCFKLLKEAVKDNEDQKLKLTSASMSNNEIIEQYKRTIEEKEEEISTLRSLLYCDGRAEKSSTDVVKIKTNSSLEIEKENIPPSTDSLELSPAQRIAFQIFLEDPKNRPELDFYKNSIQEIYEIAKNLTTVIEECQNNILSIRSKHKSCTDRVAAAELDLELLNQQSIYRNSLTKLQELHKETEHFRRSMEQAKINVLESFKLWYEGISREEYDNEYENRAETPYHNPSQKISYRSSDMSDFRTIWKQSGDGQVETPRISLRSRSRTPCSRENTPMEGPIIGRIGDIDISENSLQFRNDNKYATRKESANYTRTRPKSPLRPNLCKAKSSYSNRFDRISRDGNIGIVDGFTEDSINTILANANFRAFTPNSCFNSKEERRRSRSKSPRRRFDYKFPWVQEYNNPFSNKVQERSRSRSPQKFCTFDSFFSYDDRGSLRQKKSCDKGSNFSVVYQDIMGSNDYLSDDNVKYLEPERPYSSNSSDIEYKADEDQNSMRGCSNKYWNSRYDSKFKNKDEFNSNKDVASIREKTSANVDHSGIGVNVRDHKVWTGNKEHHFGLKTSLNTNKANFKIPSFTNNGDNNKFGFVPCGVNNKESELSLKEIKMGSPKSNFNTVLNNCNGLFLPEDSEDFKNFVKTIPLTGDVEVDEEIIKFYRTKFVCTKNS
ncbi:hypothetical protein ILUMI_24841, partial [Ignelater luminosus]